METQILSTEAENTELVENDGKKSLFFFVPARVKMTLGEFLEFKAENATKKNS